MSYHKALLLTPPSLRIPTLLNSISLISVRTAPNPAKPSKPAHKSQSAEAYSTRSPKGLFSPRCWRHETSHKHLFPTGNCLPIFPNTPGLHTAGSKSPTQQFPACPIPKGWNVFFPDITNSYSGLRVITEWKVPFPFSPLHLILYGKNTVRHSVLHSPAAATLTQQNPTAGVWFTHQRST